MKNIKRIIKEAILKEIFDYNENVVKTNNIIMMRNQIKDICDMIECKVDSKDDHSGKIGSLNRHLLNSISCPIRLQDYSVLNKDNDTTKDRGFVNAVLYVNSQLINILSIFSHRHKKDTPSRFWTKLYEDTIYNVNNVIAVFKENKDLIDNLEDSIQYNDTNDGYGRQRCMNYIKLIGNATDKMNQNLKNIRKQIPNKNQDDINAYRDFISKFDQWAGEFDYMIENDNYNRLPKIINDFRQFINNHSAEIHELLITGSISYGTVVSHRLRNINNQDDEY